MEFSDDGPDLAWLTNETPQRQAQAHAHNTDELSQYLRASPTTLAAPTERQQTRLALRPGETTFQIDPIVARNRTQREAGIELPREDGYVSREPSALQYGFTWRRKMQVRDTLMRQNSDHRFFTRVAGAMHLPEVKDLYVLTHAMIAAEQEHERRQIARLERERRQVTVSEKRVLIKDLVAEQARVDAELKAVPTIYNNSLILSKLGAIYLTNAPYVDGQGLSYDMNYFLVEGMEEEYNIINADDSKQAHDPRAAKMVASYNVLPANVVAHDLSRNELMVFYALYLFVRDHLLLAGGTYPHARRQLSRPGAPGTLRELQHRLNFIVAVNYSADWAERDAEAASKAAAAAAGGVALPEVDREAVDDAIDSGGGGEQEITSESQSVAGTPSMDPGFGPTRRGSELERLPRGPPPVKERARPQVFSGDPMIHVTNLWEKATPPIVDIASGVDETSLADPPPIGTGNYEGVKILQELREVLDSRENVEATWAVLPELDGRPYVDLSRLEALFTSSTTSSAQRAILTVLIGSTDGSPELHAHLLEMWTSPNLPINVKLLSEHPPIADELALIRSPTGYRATTGLVESELVLSHWLYLQLSDPRRLYAIATGLRSLGSLHSTIGPGDILILLMDVLAGTEATEATVPNTLVDALAIEYGRAIEQYLNAVTLDLEYDNVPLGREEEEGIAAAYTYQDTEKLDRMATRAIAFLRTQSTAPFADFYRNYTPPSNERQQAYEANLRKSAHPSLELDRMLYVHRAYVIGQRGALNEERTRINRQLALTRERLGALASEEGASVTTVAKVSARPSSLAWLRTPAISGLVEIRADVIVALDSAWETVQMTCPALAMLTRNSLMIGEGINNTFALLVAAHYAETAGLFPKQYHKDIQYRVAPTALRSAKQRLERYTWRKGGTIFRPTIVFEVVPVAKRARLSTRDETNYFY